MPPAGPWSASIEPAAIAENGARPGQRVLTGRLDRLHDLTTRHLAASPAMVHVGDVAGLALRLGWYGPPALTLEDAEQAKSMPA